MTYVKGDLLKSKVDIMMHVCNLYHTFGSGIAYHIKKKYPQAYASDCRTECGSYDKLGSYSYADIGNNHKIVNIYAMRGIGNDGHPLNRNTSYDELYDAIYSAIDDLCLENKEYNIGVPYLMGCFRAGGDWMIVEAILKSIESEFSNVHFVVYELENAEKSGKSSVFIQKQ